MSFLKIAVFIIAGIVLVSLIKGHTPTLTVLCELALILSVIINIIPEAEKLLSMLENLDTLSTVGEGSLKIMFKSFGILAVGAVVSDICRDNGEGAVAGVVELGMKILAVSCALPAFTAVIEIASTFFRG